MGYPLAAMSSAAIAAIGLVGIVVLGAVAYLARRQFQMGGGGDAHERAQHELVQTVEAVLALRSAFEAIHLSASVLTRDWLAAPERRDLGRQAEELGWRAADGDLDEALNRAGRSWRDLNRFLSEPALTDPTQPAIYELGEGGAGLIISDRRRVPELTKRELRIQLICEQGLAACDAAIERITVLGQVR